MMFFNEKLNLKVFPLEKKHRGFSGKVLLGYLVEKRLCLEPCGVHIWAS